MSPSLTDLPNELLQQILLLTPAISVAAFQQVSRRFSKLADPVIWRHQCLNHFKYWAESRQIKKKICEPPEECDWKGIYIERHKIHQTTKQLLDGIISTQMEQTQRCQTIIRFGYEAKDCLLENARADDTCDDVLARRFHSEAISAGIHRMLAVKEWSQLRQQGTGSLERPIAAYDLFILEGARGDCDDISADLDIIVGEFKEKNPDFDHATLRQKALSICKHLWENQLIGTKPSETHIKLRKCFLGVALLERNQDALPIISITILCSVAQRLSVDIQPCDYPTYAIAVLKPKDGEDLDGRKLDQGQQGEAMYLDPYASDDEIPVEALLKRMKDLGLPDSVSNVLDDAASPAELVFGTGREIVDTVTALYRRQHEQAGQTMQRHRSLEMYPDSARALYGGLWSLIIVGFGTDLKIPGQTPGRWQGLIDRTLYFFETHFPMDSTLMEEYMLPIFRRTEHWDPLDQLIRNLRGKDVVPITAQFRTEEVNKLVLYHVGQVFVHKRYGYVAVIVGWDMKPFAGEDEPESMPVDILPRTKRQSFYNVLVEDKSIRYVAEENIIIKKPKAPHSLMAHAGRFFKRWDPTTSEFVSNIEEMWPDG